jgi:hypothetical protein
LTSQSITIGETTHEIPAENAKPDESTEELIASAELVVECWEHGDLADAVRNLNQALNNIKEKSCAPASDTPSC